MIPVNASVESARAHFARHIVAGIDDLAMREAVMHAFMRVPRERFLGEPPWRVYAPRGPIWSIEDEPSRVYLDALVALSPQRQINNGQPSLHAQCLAALRPRAGETAIHIGAGGGYYSAVLGELVGPSGEVHAYEIEADLAQRAARALADRAWIRVHAQSAFAEPLPMADVLYVSAGATHPCSEWLDALRPSGRLLFPLTREDGGGSMLLVERARDRAPARRFSAHFMLAVQFIGCIGARDALQAQRLAIAFARGGQERVHSLHRGSLPDAGGSADVWCAGEGWWLSLDE